MDRPAHMHSHSRLNESHNHDDAVVTSDEDDAQHGNLIYTTVNGAGVKRGNNASEDNRFHCWAWSKIPGPAAHGQLGRRGSMAGAFVHAEYDRDDS
jgi:hypothetical protein